MSRILFAHGWAFDAAFWDPVIACLPGHACHALDFGYFGPSREALPEGMDLVVGHSLGALWAMEQPELEGLPLLAVNGFTRFSLAPGFPHGTPSRVLDRMILRLGEAPAEVLEAFRARCGAPPPPLLLNPDRLRQGLLRLRDGDARSRTERLPINALAAPDDPLLPAPMSEQMFPESLRWLPDGGHLLPWTRPADLARFILEHLT